MSTNEADKPEPAVLWTNPITILGLLFVAVGLVALLGFWLLMLFSTSAENNQYLGVFGFMILPGVLVNGLIMCPVGIMLRRRRLRNKTRCGRCKPARISVPSDHVFPDPADIGRRQFSRH